MKKRIVLRESDIKRIVREVFERSYLSFGDPGDGDEKEVDKINVSFYRGVDDYPRWVRIPEDLERTLYGPWTLAEADSLISTAASGGRNELSRLAGELFRQLDYATRREIETVAFEAVSGHSRSRWPDGGDFLAKEVSIDNLRPW
jgi:hypothetical protein